MKALAVHVSITLKRVRVRYCRNWVRAFGDSDFEACSGITKG